VLSSLWTEPLLLAIDSVVLGTADTILPIIGTIACLHGIKYS